MANGCKPTHEVLKELRDAGANPAQLKASSEFLKQVKQALEDKNEWKIASVMKTKESKKEFDALKKVVAKQSRKALKALDTIDGLPELGKVETYHDAIAKLVSMVRDVKATNNDTLMFSELVIEKAMELSGGAVLGQAVVRENKIEMATAPDIRREATNKLRSMYLRTTPEGLRIDNNGKDVASQLANSVEYRKFVADNYYGVFEQLLAQVVDVNGTHTLAHEFMHIGSTAFMRDNPEHELTKKMRTLFDLAMTKEWYIVPMMDGDKYWTTNLDEFVAEALTNPAFMKILNSTKFDKKVGILREIVDTILEMLGFQVGTTVYEEVLDGFMTMVEAQWGELDNVTEGGDQVKMSRELKGVDPEFTKDLKNAYRDQPIAVTMESGKTKEAMVDWLIGYDDGNVKLQFTLDGKEYTADVDGVTGSTKSGMNIPTLINARAQAEYVLLGSKQTTDKVDWSKFNRIENTIHGNVGKMQELLEELHTMGGEKESTEHLEYLKGLIGKMNPRFFKKMKTYIDDRAKSTGGIMTSTKIGITISKADRLAGNQQSEAEVYTHEVVHSYVAFALEAARSGNVEARKLLRELEYTLKVARENMTWKDFMPDVSIDEDLEKKNAQAMYDYVFNSANAEDEFIAHVLTNPKMMEKAKIVMLKDSVGKSLWSRVKGLFDTLLDLVSGNYEFNDRKKNVYDMTMDLTFRLAEYNTKALREAKSREKLVDVITNAINEVDAGLGDKLEEFADKWMPKGSVGPKPENKIAQAKWYGEVLSKMVLNPTYRKQLSKWAHSFGMSPEGTIQTIMRDFTEQDDLSKAVDWIALQSDRIDGAKMSLIAATSEAVTSGFKKVLSKADRKALTRVVVDTDLTSIYDSYKNVELRKMLTDDAELNRHISRSKYRLKELDEKWYNWYAFQAHGLGKYLATGEAHIAQNFSAMNIARGLLTTEYRSPSKELVRAIDEVATLTALQHTGKAEKAAVAQLLKDDRKGVTNVVEIMKNLKLEASKTVFKDSSTHMMKGYSKEVFDDRITMEVAPIADKDEMTKKGFKLVKKLDKHSGDTSGTEFGMYVSNMFGTNEFYRTSTRLTKLQSKGTSLKELAYATGDDYANIKHKTNKLKLDKARAELVTKVLKGELDVKSIEYGLAPILNEDGAVVDYRYVINKSAKEDFLGMSTDVATILGRTKGHTFDKYESAEHNEKLLEMLKKDAEDNYIPGMTTGKNDEIYVLISPNSTDEKIKDLWDILPKSFKEEAMNNKEKGLPVRRDLMNAYFGYRHLSLVDFPGLKQITPTMIKSLIKIAETLWMEFIKISKVDVLIKMPFVMVGNIMSNFMYAVMTGTINPAELIKMYVTSTKDVRDYLRKHKEMVRLQVARDTGNGRKLDIGKIAQLERELANNPIHELYQLGVYQAIVEDINTDEFTSTNKLKQLYKDKTEGVPKIIKDGMNWMYLTEETQYYKFMTEVLQMSDLVARDVENRKLKAVMDKQAEGSMKLPRWFLQEFPGEARRKLKGDEFKEFKKRSDAMRLDTVLNAFINYNKPSGSVEEYLNRVGLIMFTKYAKRIQRVISTTSIKYPIKSLMVLLGQEFIMDVETIQDQSVFTRSWYNMGLSENDLIPGKDLFNYVMEVFTPPIFQGSTYKLL